MDNYFFDDKWSELVYHILSNLNADQKTRLNGRELNLLKTDSAIKRFATTAPHRAQMVMLTRLGYDWFFGLYPVGKMLPDLMKKAYRQHTIKDTRVEVMQEMIESHVFIIDNKAVATALAMMAQNNHSDLLYINSEFLKLPRMLDQYQKTNNPLAQLLKDHNPNNVTAEYRDALRSLDMINEIVGETFRSEEFLKSVMGLTKLDYMVLHHLFRYRNNYVSLDYLKRQLASAFPSKSIPLRCNYLFKDKKLIDKLPKTAPVSYTIKADGILALGEIMNMIINRATKN